MFFFFQYRLRSALVLIKRTKYYYFQCIALIYMTDEKEKISPLKRIAGISLGLGIGAIAVFYIDVPIVQGLIGLQFFAGIFATFAYLTK